jgi:hypothetical protein
MSSQEQTPQQIAGLVYNDIEDIKEINAGLRKAFLTGKTRSLEYRKNQLKQLSFMLNVRGAAWRWRRRRLDSCAQAQPSSTRRTTRMPSSRRSARISAARASSPSLPR